MDQFKSDSKSNSKIFSDKKCLNENDIMTNGSDFVYNIINGKVFFAAYVYVYTFC